MAKAYPEELRVRVVQTYLEGNCSVAEVAQRFKVSKATVSRWLALYRINPSLEPLPNIGGRSHRKIHTQHQLALLSWLEDDPSLTQLELVNKLEQKFDLKVCQATVSNALKHMNWTIKKNTSR